MRTVHRSRQMAIALATMPAAATVATRDTDVVTTASLRPQRTRYPVATMTVTRQRANVKMKLRRRCVWMYMMEVLIGAVGSDAARLCFGKEQEQTAARSAIGPLNVNA